MGRGVTPRSVGNCNQNTTTGANVAEEFEKAQESLREEMTIRPNE